MTRHIALVMMIKNEEKRIHVSLESVLGIVNSLVIYDTGSTDSTIDIVRAFASKNELPLHMLTVAEAGEFVDYSTSRNVLLDYADTFPEIDFLLLLDANDELRGGDELRLVVEGLAMSTDQPNSRLVNCWAVLQNWVRPALEVYYNMRFLRPRTGWRYQGRIHECLMKVNENGLTEETMKLPNTIFLFQDRTKDDDKTAKRLVRDLVVLMEDHVSNKADSRPVFYLGETNFVLGKHEDAFYYYKLRTMMSTENDTLIHKEEIFCSYMRLGKIAQIFKHEWSDVMKWFMAAFETIPRAEAMVEIATYYSLKCSWPLAFTFAQLACSLGYPSSALLRVDKNVYDYERWHVLGTAGFFVNKFEEGKAGCLKAIEAGVNVDSDKANLEFYLAEEAGRAKVL